VAPFHLKKIQPQFDTGRILQEQRERLGLSLETVARQLQINKNYLVALEENCWQDLPGEFYISTFIKKYALALGLKWEKIKKNLETELKQYRQWHNQHPAATERINTRVVPRIIRKFFFSLIIVILLGYLGAQIWRVIAPPKLVVLNPATERLVQNTAMLTVTGQTDPRAKVKINSLEVSPDAYGFFSATLDLSSDLNIIKIEAKKKYSRSSVVMRNVVYNKND
jgi:cytoskeletal protein RodZ